jgi:hypothetical protein
VVVVVGCAAGRRLGSYLLEVVGEKRGGRYRERGEESRFLDRRREANRSTHAERVELLRHPRKCGPFFWPLPW